MNALYMRTSTADQDGAAQKDALRRAAEARGWTTTTEYVDIGHSGAKASRPALDDLRRDIRAGKIRQVMVFALDRIGRDLKHLLALLDELNATGVVLISLREAIDQTTPAGRLFVHVIGALAEFERQRIAERVRAGVQRAMRTGETRSGKPIGRPRRAVDLSKARQLRAEGRSLREIAVALKVPRRTLGRALDGAGAKTRAGGGPLSDLNQDG